MEHSVRQYIIVNANKILHTKTLQGQY